MEGEEEERRCAGILCIWYDPWKRDCTASYEVWSTCSYGEKIS